MSELLGYGNYFISEKSKYLFALVELDGKSRAKILDINSELYNDNKKAKEWYGNIKDIIGVNNLKALKTLGELYHNMIG